MIETSQHKFLCKFSCHLRINILVSLYLVCFYPCLRTITVCRNNNNKSSSKICCLLFSVQLKIVLFDLLSVSCKERKQKFLRLSRRDSNSQPFDYESGALPASCLSSARADLHLGHKKNYKKNPQAANEASNLPTKSPQSDN